MTVKDRVAAIFPEESEVPAEAAFNYQDQSEYLAGGKLRKWSGPFHEVLSPVSLQGRKGLERVKLGRYPLLGEKEAMSALDAAVKAYDDGRGAWPAMSVEERIKHLENFTEAMKKRRAEVVSLLMWEIGKSAEDSAREFDRTVDYIVDTLDALKELDRTSSRFQVVQGIIAQVKRAPLGVVLCMGPYNYPLNETFTTLIPALVMGNTVIFKPAKYGVLLHRPLLEAFRDSFPPGAVNTLYGDGKTVVTPIMKSGKVNVLAFIGSSGVADIIRSQHPKPHRLRCALGLDAKNAGIVLEDAEANGAKVVNAHGGAHNANFFYPAVLWGVNDKARLWREEQFGPVVPMTSFEDISAPLDYVVNSDFGQQVSIFGHDQKRMAALMDTLVNQVCRVNINTQCQRGPDVLPFTGRKDSAEGTLSVSDALRVFSIRTLVAARDSAPNKELINGIVRGRKSKFLSTDFIL
ncbi:MAG: glyceraldehyde-3-phosphate dehydrogenase (NADP) [Elusimicrobia bacterium]|nr:MAG: glyceraldehyde-3-phosphate dehydrogenase (NADP) [Elusimicrobiota bacterium]KAF0153743.1 MAG: glyceraldehyde-3-phosphate dehydrogenase (NADP) [Elusimicrobiota bacterium]